MNTGLTVGEGRLERVHVRTADGTTFDLGRPGTRSHPRRLARYVRHRLRTEPAFREVHGDTYTRWGTPRGRTQV